MDRKVAINLYYIFLLVLAILVLTTIGIRYTEPLNDGDIWFHLAYGRYFIENHTIIPDHSIFSWTLTDNTYIYCAWISEVIFYLLFKSWGISALYALRYLIIIIFTFLVIYYAIKGNASFLPVILLTYLIGLLMSNTGLLIKSEVFSFLFMTLTVWVWFRLKTMPAKGPPICYLFPIIMLIWVNSHGGFIFGIFFLGTVLLGEIINWVIGSSGQLDPKLKRHLSISILLSFISIFITPYGWHYPFQLINTLLLNPEQFSSHMSAINAYKSIFSPMARPYHFISFLLISLLILIILSYEQVKRHRYDWALLLVNLLFMIIFIKYVRATYFWAIIFVFTSIHLLQKIEPHDFAYFISNKIFIRASNIVSIVLLVLIALFTQYETYYSPVKGFHVYYHPPVEEADYIRTHFQKLRLANDYDNGSYLIWKLWPDNRVMIDARYFPYHTWYGEFNELRNNPEEDRWDTYIKKSACDVWCVLYDFPKIEYFLKSADWKLVFYGPSGCIFLSSRIPYPNGHNVPDSVYHADFYQSLNIARFAINAGDVIVAKRICMQLKPSKLWPEQIKHALNTLLSIGGMMCDLNNFSDAVDIFSYAIHIAPNSAESYLMKADALSSLGKYVESSKNYKEAIRIKPDYEMAYNNLANLFLLTHRPDEAISLFSKVIEINPQNYNARQNISIAIEQKQVKDNIPILKNKLKLQPEDSKLIEALAISYAKIGDYENALAGLKHLLDKMPNKPDLYYNIACVYAQMNKTDQAISWLEGAISKGFNNWQLLKSDNDLKNIRHTSLYKQLIQNH